MREKISTGVKSLDELLEGGIPKGHTVILAGSCGTGKTILAQQILFEGAKKGENGLYLSLSEPKEKIIQNLEDFTFFDKKQIDTGKIKIYDLATDARLQGIGLNNSQEMMSLIRKIVQDTQATRVIIDSITAIISNLEDQNSIRNFIYELGYELMYLNCTTILISEVPPQTLKYSQYGIEEFIADGVILLTDFERKGELLRALQVIKMRGVKHSRNKHVLKIIEDGINLIPLFKAEIE